jgi:ABC-type multidrug transport system ATPase subunit
VGAIIEKPDLYKYLTALQNLRIIAQLSGVSHSDEALMNQLERVGIGDRSGSLVKTFSQGMKQRLGIACALVHNPDLVILDEPTNGLDPQGIADMRNLILHLSRNESRTVLVSSHLLNEIELIADSMLIIDRGKKMAEGKVSELLNPADTLVELKTGNDEKTRSLIQDSLWNRYLQEGRVLTLKMHKAEIPALARFLFQNDLDIESIRPRHSLEEFFLSLTTANQHVAAYQD